MIFAVFLWFVLVLGNIASSDPWWVKLPATVIISATLVTVVWLGYRSERT